jgi:hypothetical protein
MSSSAHVNITRHLNTRTKYEFFDFELNTSFVTSRLGLLKLLLLVSVIPHIFLVFKYALNILLLFVFLPSSPLPQTSETCFY